MPITIPDDPRIEARAKAAGFEDITTYVRYLIEVDLAATESSSGNVKQPAYALPYQEWRKQFDALLTTARDRGQNVSYDRESFYPDHRP